MAKVLLSIFLVLVAVSSSLGKPEKVAVKKEKRIPQTLSRGKATWTWQSTASVSYMCELCSGISAQNVGMEC